MDTNNPAEMSNKDLEDDMKELHKEAKIAGNQEHVKLSTAAEGDLISPENDANSKAKIPPVGLGDERDLDDLIHDNPEETEHVGGIPDPEELDHWESNDDDPDKISS